MKTVLLLLGFLTLATLGSMPSAAVASTTIMVPGQNDAEVDRVNIQQALDTAAPGDTVTLSGTFQLDGVPLEIRRSGITLAGVTLDNDGDGAMNEDWVDGVDNDGDGATDEDDWDTWLYGLTDANGEPLENLLADSFFNHALVIQGGSGNLADISIRGLAFSGFARHIALFAGAELSQGMLCDGISLTDETIRRISISRNLFLNANRTVVADGPVQQLQFSDNVSQLDSLLYDLLVQSGLACFNADGSQLPITLGPPRHAAIVGNRFTGAAASGVVTKGAIWLAEGEVAEVSGNHINAYTLGLGLIIGGRNVHVHHNEIYDNMLAIVGVLGAKNNRITYNVIVGSMWGIVLDVAASGYQVANNKFADNLYADINLHGYGEVLIPHDNQIIGTDFATKLVLDSFDGTVSPEEIEAANSFVGTFARTHGAGIPPAVRASVQNDLAGQSH